MKYHTIIKGPKTIKKNHMLTVCTKYKRKKTAKRLKQKVIFTWHITPKVNA